MLYLFAFNLVEYLMWAPLVVYFGQIDNSPIYDIQSKAIAKAGTAKYQWQIMQSLGLVDEEIKKFANASHWLDHFPPLAVEDLLSIGLHVSSSHDIMSVTCCPYEWFG